MVYIDRLAEGYYSRRDPQFDDGKRECACCGQLVYEEDMVEIGGDFFCRECADDIRRYDDE